MSKKNQEIIRNILKEIIDKKTNSNLNELVDYIVLQDDKAIFAININEKRKNEFEELKKIAVKTIEEELGIKAVVTLTSAQPQKDEKTLKNVDGVKKVILVASGKGGVGKSTIAFNLAIALANLGYKVGIVDTDIYGPSLPKLSGISRKPILANNLMIPHKKFNIKLMSVGYLVDETQALIWRGPMTTKMLYQLIRLTNWAHDGKELDYLIIDSPPGTGDVHLSLAENYKIDGAIVITTPQDLATADAVKALAMFKKVNIPVLGIIENMAYFKDPSTGKPIYIFGKGGAEIIARKYKSSIIAKVPINSDVVSASDKGKPLTYYKPKHEISKIFNEFAIGLNTLFVSVK